MTFESVYGLHAYRLALFDTHDPKVTYGYHRIIKCQHKKAPYLLLHHKDLINRVFSLHCQMSNKSDGKPVI